MAVVRFREQEMAFHEQEPEGATEHLIPRRGNKLPVRVVRTVDTQADFEETVTYERDPLTKRGRRQVRLQRFHPRYTGVMGSLWAIERRILESFYRKAEV